MFRKKCPVAMNWQKFHFMIVSHSFHFTLVAGFHIPQHFQVAETSAGLKDSTKDHISFIEGKISDKRMNGFSY